MVPTDGARRGWQAHDPKARVHGDCGLRITLGVHHRAHRRLRDDRGGAAAVVVTQSTPGVGAHGYLASAGMWALDRKRQRWAEDVQWLSAAVARVVPEVIRRHATPRTLAGVAAAATVILGIASGAHVLGGADAYGYVSQAHFWATGQLKVPQPLLDELPAGDSRRRRSFHWRIGLSPDRKSVGTVYAPGLPMVMSVLRARRWEWTRCSLVVPISWLALAVWMTVLRLGDRFVGELGGSIAAVFLAMSPAFVLSVGQSADEQDVAAAAWWTTALFLTWRPGRVAAFGAGHRNSRGNSDPRPDLAPLAIVPGVAFYDRPGAAATSVR